MGLRGCWGADRYVAARCSRRSHLVNVTGQTSIALGSGGEGRVLEGGAVTRPKNQCMVVRKK